jgi:hypothetical protein
MLLFAVGAAASGQQITGKIKSVAAAERMVTLEDGTQLWVSEGLALETLQEGKSVKAAYEEREGKKVVTGFEVTTE